jgi:transmembrane sensor
MEVERRRPLGELLRDSIDDAALERMCDRVEARRRAEPVARRGVGLVTISVAAAAAVVLVVAAAVIWSGRDGRDVTAPRESRPIAVVGGSELARIAVAAAAPAPQRFELSDGSSVELAPGTAVAADVNTGRQVALKLVEGRATFDVEPGGPRRWSVDTGLVLVEVVGTEFTVSVEPGRVEVDVSRGRVLVRGGLIEGGSRVLEPGEQLAVVEPEEPERPLVASEEVEVEPEPEASASEPASRADGGARVAAAASWQRLARDGDYGTAYQLLGPPGVQRETTRVDTMAELLTLADVARLSGHAADAVPPLERALREFSSDRRAAIAAFTLGRIETDRLRRHDRGARAFRRCLELGAPRALQEDAFARLATAHARGGDYEAARTAAREYLRRFPDGRHAEELGRWIEPR